MTGEPDVFPSRSIISLTACAGQCGTEGCGALVIGCDCATTTHLTIDFGGHAPDRAEVAVTCDGCLTVHWLDIRGQA